MKEEEKDDDVEERRSKNIIYRSYSVELYRICKVNPKPKQGKNFVKIKIIK